MTRPFLACGRTHFFEESVPCIAAILNVSTDSFSGDGMEDWKAHADRILQAGVKWIDTGAESTRPGSQPVPAQREMELLLPVLRYLRANAPDVIISADTKKAVVAEAAIQAGADVVNDVSGLGDPEMASVIAKYGAGLVLMHTRGTPATMQFPENLAYENLTEEVCRFFEDRIAFAKKCGIDRKSIILDPGIGFAKTTDGNLELMRNVSVFHKRFDLPMFYGVSRKRFIGELTGRQNAAERDAGTAGALIYLAEVGVEILRVHGFQSAKDAIKMYQVLKSNSTGDR